MDHKEQQKARKTMAGACDIFEEQGQILLRIDMPGVTRENLAVHVENDELQISGKRSPFPGGSGRYLVREIPDRDFYQAYTLDSTIDRNAIEAHLAKGQLIVTLSLKESEKPRKIDITARD